MSDLPGAGVDPSMLWPWLNRHPDLDWLEVGEALGCVPIATIKSMIASARTREDALRQHLLRNLRRYFRDGVLDATWQTGEYFEDLALSNTAENRQDSFVSPEQMEGAEFWLAVAWVGAGIDLASGVKVLALLRGGAHLADALRAVGHAGKEAALLAETAGKNLVDELRRLVPNIELDPAFATAGGPGGLPYDRVVRGPQVPNEEVRALRPDGWAARVEDGDELGELSWSGGGRSSQAEPQSYLDNLAEEGIHPAGTVRAGMARRPRHHVFPDEHRTWFEDHGFVGEWDIDNFTVEMDGGFHAAIHGGGDWKTGRALSKAKGGGKDLTPEMQAELDAWAGEWNTMVMDALLTTEADLGRKLTRDEAFEVVSDVMERFGISPDFVPYRSP